MIVQAMELILVIIIIITNSKFVIIAIQRRLFGQPN